MSDRQGEELAQQPGAKGANRDANGRFLPGHSLPGPGNPNCRYVSQLRAEIREATEPARVRKVFDAMLTKAENGDTTAAQIVLDRLLGRPVQPMEIDAPVAQEQRQSVISILNDPKLLILANQLAMRSGEPGEAAE